MASNITAQSVLEEMSQDHLECPICTERFKQPKLLECSHSFCYECLQQLRKISPNTAILSCPVCRQETLLNANGIDDLKMDYKFISLLDAIEKQETQLKRQQGKQLPSQEFVSKCSKHTDKDLILYCETCKKLICTTCIAKDHQMHPAIELNEASKKSKQLATELLAELRQSIKTFNIAIQEIDTSRKTLDSMFTATKEKISKKADEKNARIKEEKQKLMQEAEQIYKYRVKPIETARATNNIELNKAEVKLDEVNELITDQRIKIVHYIEQLLQDLKEYREMKSTKLPDGLTYMDFKEGQKSLGRLVLKDEQQVESAISAGAEEPTFQSMKYLKQNKWTLKSEMNTHKKITQQLVKTCPLYVTANSNGDIVMLHWNSLSLIKKSAESNPQSTFIPQELSIKGLTRPSKVTVNKNDELIVLDNDTVKIFNRNYKLLDQFNPGSELSSCIAVYDNNLIAVGHSIKAEISLHKPGGSLIRTLPAPGIGDYLTTYKQQLIYINWVKSKLVSVDYDGKVIFSVDIDHSCWASGVCCDKDGCIYVCVVVRKTGLLLSSSGEIHHYSLDGRFIGCIIKGCHFPKGLTVTPAGDLVVATDKSVQIYQYE